jgi:hypothetical protein
MEQNRASASFVAPQVGHARGRAAPQVAHWRAKSSLDAEHARQVTAMASNRLDTTSGRPGPNTPPNRTSIDRALVGSFLHGAEDGQPVERRLPPASIPPRRDSPDRGGVLADRLLGTACLLQLTLERRTQRGSSVRLPTRPSMSCRAKASWVASVTRITRMSGRRLSASVSPVAGEVDAGHHGHIPPEQLHDRATEGRGSKLHLAELVHDHYPAFPGCAQRRQCDSLEGRQVHTISAHPGRTRQADVGEDVPAPDAASTMKPSPRPPLRS